MTATAEAVPVQLAASAEPAPGLRIASAQELAGLAADLAIAARVLPADTARRLYPVFLLLVECQAELLRPATTELPAQLERVSGREADAVRAAHLLRQLQDLAPGERAQIVMQRLDWSKSKYYRARTDALQLGLL